MTDFGEGNRPGNGGLGGAFNSILDAFLYGNTYVYAKPDGAQVDPAKVELVAGYLPVTEELNEDYLDLWSPKHTCQTHEEARESVRLHVTGSRHDVAYQEAKIQRAKKKLKKLRKRLAKAEQALVDFDETYPMEE